jgi:hypothetical protein
MLDKVLLEKGYTQEEIDEELIFNNDEEENDDSE